MGGGGAANRSGKIGESVGGSKFNQKPAPFLFVFYAQPHRAMASGLLLLFPLQVGPMEGGTADTIRNPHCL